MLSHCKVCENAVYYSHTNSTTVQKLIDVGLLTYFSISATAANFKSGINVVVCFRLMWDKMRFTLSLLFVCSLVHKYAKSNQTEKNAKMLCTVCTLLTECLINDVAEVT